MALEKLGIFFDSDRPNNFTRQMGVLIKQAREEAKLSQTELAKLIHRRQASLSDMENGKVEPDASTLASLSYYLRKPISFFYPPPFYEGLVISDMDALSLEMQMHFEQIYGDDLKKLAIDLVRTLGEFDPKHMVNKLAPVFKDISEIENKKKEARAKRRKK